MKKENLFNDSLQVSSFNGEGYLPLIDFQSWRVAELRYIDELEPDKIDNMQKHNETDEVFVVLEGDFTLYLGGQGDTIEEIEAIKLEPLKLYNVKKVHFTLTHLIRIVHVLLLKIKIQQMTIHLR